MGRGRRPPRPTNWPHGRAYDRRRRRPPARRPSRRGSRGCPPTGGRARSARPRPGRGPGTVMTAIAKVSQSVAWTRSPYSRSVMARALTGSGWAGLALAGATIWRPFRVVAPWDPRDPVPPVRSAHHAPDGRRPNRSFVHRIRESVVRTSQRPVHVSSTSRPPRRRTDRPSAPTAPDRPSPQPCDNRRPMADRSDLAPPGRTLSGESRARRRRVPDRPDLAPDPAPRRRLPASAPARGLAAPRPASARSRWRSSSSSPA